MRILVVEDEKDLNKIITKRLQNEGYSVDSCFDGEQALLFLSVGEFDAVIMDIMMPELDGWEATREIRRHSAVPIMLLSARSQDFDQLTGFESGADDYVTKPFSPAVLMKRVEALLRRSGSGFVSDTDELWGLSVNKDAHEVKVYGEAVSLTLKEYSILIKLLGFVGRVYSREQLLDDVWGFDYDGDIRTVDSHVARLRTKLGDWGTKHLHTVYGVGYKIEE